MTFTYIPRSPEAVAARAAQKFDGKVGNASAKKFLKQHLSCANPPASCSAKPQTLKAKPLPAKIKFGSLIPRAALVRAYENYLAEQAAQAGPQVDRVAVLIEVVTEDPRVTVAQLVEASGMSASWVRRNLRAAGLMPPAKPRRTITTAFVTGGSQ